MQNREEISRMRHGHAEDHHWRVFVPLDRIRGQVG